ncbi:MAG: hypothetical protein AAGA77_16915 [Bacteroidota bacterium]
MYKYHLVLLALVLLFFSCKDDCPDSYLFTVDELPDCERSFIKYWDVTNLTFVSEHKDTLSFERYNIELDRIRRELIKEARCSEDEDQIVEIYYKRRWNIMLYASEFEDSIAFQFAPIKLNLPDFSFEKYDLIEAKGPIELPPFYQTISMKFQETSFSLTGSIPDKNNNCQHRFTYLNQDYTMHDQSYDDVYFWDVLDPIILYFSDEYGIIGLKDIQGRQWIRVM